MAAGLGLYYSGILAELQSRVIDSGQAAWYSPEVMLAISGSHHLREAAPWISTSINVAIDMLSNRLWWWRGGHRPSGLEEFRV